MPHQFMSVICRECKEEYCPVCKEKCPKCGARDLADIQTMINRRKMREHMNRKETEHLQEKKDLQEQANQLKLSR